MLWFSLLLPFLAGVAVASYDWSDSEDQSDPDSAEALDEIASEMAADVEDPAAGGSDMFAGLELTEPPETSAAEVDDAVEAASLSVAAPAVEAEAVIGDEGDDILIGTDEGEEFDARGGDDRIVALGGNDLIQAGEGEDTILGGYGADLASGGGGDDLVKGGLGNDFLYGNDGDDTLIGGGGDDVIEAGLGSDVLHGDQGDDLLFAFDLEDTEATPDLLLGGEGNDRLIGDNGDTLTGGDGVNRFEVFVGHEGDAPTVITDFDLFHDADAELRSDLLSVLNDDGTLLSRAQLLERGGRIETAANGEDANLILDGRVFCIVEGYTSEDMDAESNWLGNFSPELTGRLDGDDVVSGDAGGVVVADVLTGGAGDDTLTGGDGADLLRGGFGDDLLDGIETSATEHAVDTLVGGEGDDTILADSGDLVGGQGGTDSYQLVVPQITDGAPIEIYGYETLTSDGQIEIVTLIDANGVALTAAEVAGNLVIYQNEDGSEAVLEFNGQQIAKLHGIDSNVLQDQTLWIGNFDPDPETGFASSTAVSASSQISMTLQNASATGQIVNAQMFGSNAVYSVNTDLGVPLDNYVAAVDALDIVHVRFPAGQSDPEQADGEGVSWLNIMDLEPDETGELGLRTEVTNALDAVIAAHENGNDVQLTLGVPTKVFTLAEYEAMYDEMARFAEIIVTDYGDVVEALEIGNEYWIIGETDYGQKADIAARAFAEGMENAGVAEEDQPDIIVQMASPNNGSEFHQSVDDRSFDDRRDDANQQIIDQLSDEARDAIDGVVEHYYYNKHDDVFTDASSEFNYIDKDYKIWEQNFDKELDVHITEWNIRTTNFPQNGMRAAGVIAEQFENMIENGADAAHSWPTVHNTNSHHAGTRSDMPIVDDDDRVLNSVRGAMFDVMSSELVGTELIESVFSNDDGRVEIQTYRSDDKVVVQVVSRTDEPLDLDLDVSTLVNDFESVSGILVGYDKSADSSDGIYKDKEGEYIQAEGTMIDGELYYFNEYDTRATITDVEFDSNELNFSLNPYEVMQVTFILGDNEGFGPDPSEEVRGTDGDDLIVMGNGNDLVESLDGNDTVQGNGGIDTIYGGMGDDLLEGGKGDDYVRGEEGDDAIYGHGNDDDMKGHDGNDSISGNQGNDTLSGSKGDDLLRGGEGEDSLNGGVGSDTLAGGEGRDTLTGWSGTDTFRFEGDHLVAGDLITDFEVGVDVIEFDYDDISSVSDLVIQNVQGGVVINVGSHGSLYLQGQLTATQLGDPQNYIFV